MGLYLLIWGEAANLRFMPECLCYIFHHMAIEVLGLLNGYVNPMTGECVKRAYEGEEEAFLREVVTPIYEVIAKEAERSKRGRLAHSQWRNYDDLNEYFWSDECFGRLGWPMCVDADFFHLPAEQIQFEKAVDSEPAYPKQWVRKVNFVEIRSFWHIFRSYDRMWSFFILCLQALIIIAWNGSGDPTALFTPDVFKKVLSIFVTAAILNLGQAVLDVILTWKARRSMSYDLKLRYNLKVFSATAWFIILSVTFAHPLVNPPGSTQTIKSWFGNGSKSPSLFILAVVVYHFPNMLAAWLFLFPSICRFLERLPYKIGKQMIWWSQPPLYVGRGMHESAFSLFMYTLFWVFLIITKLAFSYYIEIKPLVGPTKAIMSVRVTKFQSHEFFARANDNIGVVISLWAPIILVYFMDTQIWFALFSTCFGGLYGVARRLGETNILGIRSRFKSLPGVFNARLIGKEKAELKKDGSEATSSQSNARILSKIEKARFAQLWNTIVTSFREDDLISNREMNLLIVPYWAEPELEIDIIQWPPFLLASKIAGAVELAKDSDGKGRELRKIIETDRFLSCAIRECYAQFRNIIMLLVQGEREKKIIRLIFSKVDKSLEDGNLSSKALPSLYDCFVKLIKCLLDNKQEDRLKVVLLFVEMLCIFRNDIEVHTSSLSDSVHGGSGPEGITPPLHEQVKLFASAGALRFPINPANEAWKEKIKRLDLLLTAKESAMGVPSNSEARRRISFFIDSLFMEMPAAPKVRNMLSFSVLTPHYKDKVLFSAQELQTGNEKGVSILFYLQNTFPDEWTNFLERLQCKNVEELRQADELGEQLCLWASLRGQTLTRSVRGVMYYRKALELQAFLDIATNEELNTEEHPRGDESLLAQCRAEVDMKFMHVISCQQYNSYGRSKHQRSKDILRLLTAYPSLRVAYIDEVEQSSQARLEKAYYSTLVKAALPKSKSSSEPASNLEQVIYRIKLPGPAILGQGKSENQNNAIIYTRGECLQTINMNQDNYMEEALKMRNLLQEFLEKGDGVRYPTILGLREHIFTGSVSSLAWFMSNQESSFSSIGQRLLANPLRVHFHYGHSDVFDRLFHLTRGGVSKDIFAGFSSTLREGSVTHHEYIQVGKGRDLSLKQISMFEAKTARGNGEQTLSRDVYRLGHGFDFFRMLSCYFTTIGFYISTLITVLTVYVFLYGRLYLVLSGLEKELSTQPGIKDNKPLQVDLASQSFLLMHISSVLPMLMEIWVERGYLIALRDFVLIQVQGVPVFLTFSLGTKAHYYGRTLLHGGARYRGARYRDQERYKASGHGLVVFRTNFVDNYRMYSRSHFVKGFELMILLLVYHIFSQSYRGAVANNLWTKYIWFMIGSWLFAPFLFNPYGFEWHEIVGDWRGWNEWLRKEGGVNVHPKRSWEAWWEKEQEHLRHSGKCVIIAEIILALRFFMCQCGLFYHLIIVKHANGVLVLGISSLVFVLVLFVMRIVSNCQQRGKAELLIFIHLIVGFLLLVVTFITPTYVSLQDIMACILASLQTGWGMILIAQACEPLIFKLGIWGAVILGEVKTLAHGYEIIMGFFLFAPVAFLAWFSYISELQTHILFIPAFVRGLQIWRILGSPVKETITVF